MSENILINNNILFVNMPPKYHNVFWKIINCPNIKNYQNQSSPCGRIISYQTNFLQHWHSCEPWTGDLENAGIMFLSSNPSYTANEVFPVRSGNVPLFKAGFQNNWSPQEIEDFFCDRLQGSCIPSGKRFVQQLCVLQNNGQYSKPVPTWIGYCKYSYALKNVNNGSIQPLNKSVIQIGPNNVFSVMGSSNIITPGSDFVISEIVKCKSKSEIGVNKAQQYCFTHFRDTLQLFLTNNFDGNRTLFIVGEKAAKAFNRFLIHLQQIKTSISYVQLPDIVYTNGKPHKRKPISVTFSGNISGTIEIIFAPHPSPVNRQTVEINGWRVK